MGKYGIYTHATTKQQNGSFIISYLEAHFVRTKDGNLTVMCSPPDGIMDIVDETFSTVDALWLQNAIAQVRELLNEIAEDGANKEPQYDPYEVHNYYVAELESEVLGEELPLVGVPHTYYPVSRDP